jgi:predicted PhzF superfamily epimerase YddE/YHI9
MTAEARWLTLLSKPSQRLAIRDRADQRHIEQGVEIKRPSQIFVKAGREGANVLNVCVGGNAVEIAESEYSL